MGELIDAINRLDQAISDAEKRLKAKQVVQAGFAVGWGTIPTFPPLPNHTWSTQSAAEDHIDGMTISSLDTWKASCVTWKNNQDPG